MFVFDDKEIGSIEELETAIAHLDDDSKSALREAFATIALTESA